MKTRNTLLVTFLLLFHAFIINAQNKERIAVVSIETNGLLKKQKEITSMVNLEFQKLQFYEVIEKQDMLDYITGQMINPDSCYSLKCLISIGKAIHADKIASGTMQRMGEKIVFSIRIIDVKTEKVEKSQVNEYINHCCPIKI